MSRLSAYFAAKKLIGMHLATAEVYDKRGINKQAFTHLLLAVREQQTALNCLASIAFDKKPRKRRAPVCGHTAEEPVGSTRMKCCKCGRVRPLRKPYIEAMAKAAGGPTI